MIHLRKARGLGKLKNVSEFNVKINTEVDDSILKTLKNVKSYSRDERIAASSKQQTVVVEFSSPNIAKPFHIGHLRSTIVGNFVANLFEKYAKCHVIRLNYLGDWGLQFGLLKIGLDLLYNNESNAKVFDVENPMKSLHEAYVFANKLAENDETIRDRAQKIFHSMENATNKNLIDEWKQFQEITVKYLERTYARLGIHFDKYDFESLYASRQIESLKKEVSKVLYEGQKFQFANKEVIVMKKDGTSLYLTRDLAAAIDRFERYHFDRMLYVVSDQQLFHFKVLFELLKRCNHEWAERLTHVVFGNVSGMSSRKGEGVFLHDILDELSLRMYQKQISTQTTKVSKTDKRTADVLAVSCMVIDSLRHKRSKHIAFDWDKALKTDGNSAVKLQYTHCRLHSILQNNSLSAAQQIDVNFLISSIHRDIIIELIECLAQFPEVLEKCYVELEAKYLIKYLFRLCNKLNNVANNVHVKQMQGDDEKKQALLLFESGRFILKSAMEILGLQVLNEM